MSAYQKLPRWARWTLPIVLILLIIGAATPSPNKKSSARVPAQAHSATQAAKDPKGGWTIKPGPTLKTRAQVIAAADAICRKMNNQLAQPLKQLQALKEQAEAPIQQEAPPLLTKIGRTAFAASVDLQDLSVTAGAKLPLDKLGQAPLDLLGQALGATGTSYTDESAALTTGDAQGITSNARDIARTATIARNLARNYGLRQCIKSF